MGNCCSLHLFSCGHNHHHPTPKLGVMLRLLDRAHQEAEGCHLKEELNRLQMVFQKNGLTRQDIRQTFTSYKNKSKRKSKEEEDLTRGGGGEEDVAVIPYCNTVTNRLARVLRHRNITTTSYLLVKIKQKLRSVKDPLGLNVPGSIQFCVLVELAKWARLVELLTLE